MAGTKWEEGFRLGFGDVMGVVSASVASQGLVGLADVILYWIHGSSQEFLYSCLDTSEIS